MTSEGKSGSYLKILVTPKSAKNQIVEVINNELKIKIAAPPEDGKANKELIKFLSKTLKIEKSKIEITKGQSSRHKTLLFIDLKDDDLKKLLAPYISSD